MFSDPPGAVATFADMRVYVSPDLPRYVLPERLDLPCGYAVEWPHGFRDEFNVWSESFLGYINLVPDGISFVEGRRMWMNPRTYQAVMGAALENSYSLGVPRVQGNESLR